MSNMATFVSLNHERMLAAIHERKDFSMMDMQHHYLSGMKSLFTEWGWRGLDACRLACGGAGYLGWSGFVEHMNFYSPLPTFEGDNTVMM